MKLVTVCEEEESPELSALRDDTARRQPPTSQGESSPGIESACTLVWDF